MGLPAVRTGEQFRYDLLALPEVSPTASPYGADNCLVVVALSYRSKRGLPGSFPGVLLAHCLVAYLYETRTQKRVYHSLPIFGNRG